MSDNFLAEKNLLVGMHQSALADGGAGLHQADVGWALLESEIRHSGRNRSRTYDQKFVVRQVELVHQRAQLPSVNSPAGGDQAGTDFDDQAHELI